MKTYWFNIKYKMLALAAVSSLIATSANAQESTVPVPWENIVSADDTAVFWVLTSFAVLLLILIWVVAGVTKGLLSDTELWKGKWDGAAKTVAAIVGTGLLFSSTGAFAETAEGGSAMFEMSDGLFWIMVIVDAFLLLVLLGMLYNLSSLIKSLRTVPEAEEVVEETVTESIWTGSLSGAVPIEQEKDILMDHEYDGIMELDNKLPPWWLYMFYFTIVFGVFYVGYYHFSDGLSQEEEYLAEMAVAEAQKAEFLASAANNVDESNAEVLTDATALANGKEKFETLCVACHAATGGSTQNPPGVGPNLTDKYWLHGGGVKNIFKTIKYGVPAKGMISWEAQLSPRQIQEVASYIISLEGSNPPNAKDPQGEIWSDEGETAPAPADSTSTEEAPAAEDETADAAE
jgi:cytochrome c oxidase cbb3-type subunit 3